MTNRATIIVNVLTLVSIFIGLTLNFLVVGSCDFLVLPNGGQLGLFQYRTDNSQSDVCITYSGKANDMQIKGARVCSVLAIAFGLFTIFLVVAENRALCDPFPYQTYYTAFCMVATQFCSAFVWWVTQSIICHQNDCTWGTAATYQVVSQVFYFLGGMIWAFMPHGDLEEGEQEPAEKGRRQDEDDEKEGEEGEVEEASFKT
jgi:hypothetical protein